MNCPVCDVALEVALSPGQELLYDCPSCESSLFFNGDEIEILNQKESPVSDSNLDSPDEILNQKENPISDSNLDSPASEDQTSNEMESQDISEVSPQVPTLDFKPEADDFEKNKDSLEGQLEQEPFSSEDSLDDSELSPSDGDELSSEESISSNSASEHKAVSNIENEDEKVADEKDIVDPSGLTASKAEEGLLFYDVIIKKIDSKELREEIQSILEDDILNLKYQNAAIKNGMLTLKKVPAVKVHIIVKSLIGLSIEITWTQYLATDL